MVCGVDFCHSSGSVCGSNPIARKTDPSSYLSMISVWLLNLWEKDCFDVPEHVRSESDFWSFSNKLLREDHQKPCHRVAVIDKALSTEPHTTDFMSVTRKNVEWFLENRSNSIASFQFPIIFTGYVEMLMRIVHFTEWNSTFIQLFFDIGTRSLNII